MLSWSKSMSGVSFHTTIPGCTNWGAVGPNNFLGIICASKCHVCLGSCSKNEWENNWQSFSEVWFAGIWDPTKHILSKIQSYRCIQEIHFLYIYIGHRLKKLLGWNFWVTEYFVQWKQKILPLHWLLYSTNLTHTQYPKQFPFDPWCIQHLLLLVRGQFSCRVFFPRLQC